MANDLRREEEKAIRLDDILFVLLKHHKAVIGLALIGMMVGVLVSFAFYLRGLTTVEYYVTASIAVTSTNENGMFSSDTYNPNAQDIHLAEDMTDAVIYVCKSDTTLNAAAERLALIGVSAGDIRPKLMLSQYQKTQIIEMTLIWDNAEEGMMILNAITDVVPDILIQTLKLGDVTIVNPPKVHTSSLSFINVKIVAICTLAGAFIACAYYLLLFFLHPTYLHSEDVVNAYNLEIIGEIPKDKYYFGIKINSIAANDFYSVQEYFSACAHVLVYRLQEYNHACIYITSSAAKEGKTSITANIAYMLSKLGYKILLMDMDIRNPSLSSKFIMEVDEDHCLNAVVSGKSKIHEALITINENLDILPTRLEQDSIPLDNKVIEIISSAKQYYDFVILDTAPVGQVSDSLSLNQAADFAVFVVRQDQVWINTVTDSINRLKKSGIDIMGIIMNDTRSGSSNYYNYNVKQFGDSPYVHSPKKYGAASELTKKRSIKPRDTSRSRGIFGMSEAANRVEESETLSSSRKSKSSVSPEEMAELEKTPVNDAVALMDSEKANEVPVPEDDLTTEIIEPEEKPVDEVSEVNEKSEAVEVENEVIVTENQDEDTEENKEE